MPSTILGCQSPHLKLFSGGFVPFIALIFGYFVLFFNNGLRLDKLDCKAIENLFSWDIQEGYQCYSPTLQINFVCADVPSI